MEIWWVVCFTLIQWTNLQFTNGFQPSLIKIKDIMYIMFLNKVWVLCIYITLISRISNQLKDHHTALENLSWNKGMWLFPIASVQWLCSANHCAKSNTREWWCSHCLHNSRRGITFRTYYHQSIGNLVQFKKTISRIEAITQWQKTWFALMKFQFQSSKS